MELIYKDGDLLDATEDAIGHGVNCFGMMGAGVAVAVRRAYGERMYICYRDLCEAKRLLPGGVHVWQGPILPVLFNMASQDKPGADASYEWLGQSLYRSVQVMQALGLQTLALPRIGCGIGGLEWEKAAWILAAAPIQITIYTPKTTPWKLGGGETESTNRAESKE